MLVVVWFWKLRPNVVAADFERFLMETEYPAMRRVPSVAPYHSIRINGPTRGDHQLPYDYIDVAEITNIDDYREDLAEHPAIKELQGEFEKYVEPLGNFWAELIEE